MRKLIMLLALLMLPAMLVAQQAAPDLDLGKVELILLTGIGGLGVSSLTEIVKRFFKWLRIDKPWLGYVSSAVVSAAATAYYLSQTGWNIALFVVYSALVWGAANGFYKVAAKAARGE